MHTQSIIISKLTTALSPSHLEVINESHKHSGPRDAETHFKIVIVTDAFSHQRAVARHQMIYKTLVDELAANVHALAIHTYTDEEWSAQPSSPDSPQCLGGSKHDKATK
ncbi:BolA/IbaG family iron-sulfur metabolism protein [bacterium]|nr:BolA/IbaG family iron-sulfur metabolism protein [bacterium]